MSSKKTAAVDWFDLDLERDMPLTDRDVEAMRIARKLALLPPEEYQRWVDLLGEHHGEPLRRLNTDDDEPFTL